MIIRLLLSVTFVTHALLGQAVTFTVTAARPATCSASIGGVAQTSTLPAGPLATNGFLNANSGALGTVVAANVGWSSDGSSTEAAFDIQHTISSVGTASPTGSTDIEFVVALSTPVATPVWIHLVRWQNVSAGTPTPLLRVDVADDGVVDMTEASPPQFLGFVLGPQPLPVRFRMQASAAGIANVLHRCRLTVVSGHPLPITRLLLPCDVPQLTCEPTFAGTVRMTTQPVPNGLMVLALGLGAQLTPLPPSLPAPPFCAWLPTPDSVQFLPQWSYDLAIPAAFRPATLYAQALVLTPGSITPTDAFRIRAL